VKEGGGSKLFRHAADMLGLRYDSHSSELYNYFKTTKGTMGVWEAITQPLILAFWSWVMDNVVIITKDKKYQQEIQEIIDYAEKDIDFKSKSLIAKNVDAKPVFP
jgi:hypothetical protein